ncbi:MAG: AraC family transcriptional regulator [Butyricicoccaceae bacterium]
MKCSGTHLPRMIDLLSHRVPPEQSADTPAEQAIQYIRSHIGQPISVEDLASTVCLSASYFAHMFKRRTGFSLPIM